MDEDRRGEKREKPEDVDSRKERIRAFFSELRRRLKTHGYPVKDRVAGTQNVATLIQKEEASTSTDAPAETTPWVPTFKSYEDFNRMTLQSIDGFMMILSVDGVIIFVADNIISLLGYSPDEIIGKKLLSLLPDGEKSEVYRKIAIKCPMSVSVGRHIEFCCHFRRGDCQRGGTPSYEYVKFILAIKDISNEPLVLFTSFFPRQPYHEYSGATLPLEDRYYLVGSVCIIQAKTLQGLLCPKEVAARPQSEEDMEVVFPPGPSRYFLGQKTARARTDTEPEALTSEFVGITNIEEFEFLEVSQNQKNLLLFNKLLGKLVQEKNQFNPCDIVTIEHYGSQESPHIISVDSDSSTDNSTSPDIVPQLPEPPSLWSSQDKLDKIRMDKNEGEDKEQKEKLLPKHKIRMPDQVVRVEQEAEAAQSQAGDTGQKARKADHGHELSQEAKEDKGAQAGKERQLDLEEEVNLWSSSLAALISSQPSSSMTSTTDRQEMELMRKFTMQLDKRTHKLHADVNSQKIAMEVMRQQMKTLHNLYQIELAASHHLEHPEPQTVEPGPSRQGKRPSEELPNLGESKRFKVPVEVEPYSFSTQNLQEQEMEKEQLPEEPMEEELMEELMEEQRQPPMVLKKPEMEKELPQQKKEKEKLQQKTEKEKLPQQKAEKEKLPQQKMGKEKLPQKTEKEKLPQQKTEKEKLPQQKTEKEKLPQQKTEKEKLPQQKTEKEKLPQQKTDKEKLPQQKTQKEKVPHHKEKVPHHKPEKEKVPHHKLEKEKPAHHKPEKEKPAHHKPEKEKPPHHHKTELEKEKPHHKLEREKVPHHKLEKEKVSHPKTAKEKLPHKEKGHHKLHKLEKEKLPQQKEGEQHGAHGKGLPMQMSLRNKSGVLPPLSDKPVPAVPTPAEAPPVKLVEPQPVGHSQAEHVGDLDGSGDGSSHPKATQGATQGATEVKPRPVPAPGRRARKSLASSQESPLIKELRAVTKEEEEAWIQAQNFSEDEDPKTPEACWDAADPWQDQGGGGKPGAPPDADGHQRHTTL